MRDQHAVISLDEAVPATEEKKPNPLTPPRSNFKRFRKVLLIVCVSLAAILFIVYTIWVYSGSNRWEFFGEKNGVKAYTLKAPGSGLIQAKGIFRVHSTLAGVVELMQDIHTCDEVAGCSDPHVIQQIDDLVQYDYYRNALPFPFRPRDYAIMTQVYQSPKTKEVLVEYSAAPDITPLKDCCVRVTRMNNTWRLVPLGNGEIQIEYVINLEMGGFIPDAFLNMMYPRLMFNLSGLQPILNRDKYQKATFSYITE